MEEFWHYDKRTNRRAFRRRLRMRRSLEHPNLVKVLDGGESERGPYVLMELCEGRPLSELTTGRALTTERTVALLRGVASALDLANSRGLVHLELSPANILVEDGERGRALLTDFGVAPEVSPERMILTPDYRSPEELRSLPPEPASNVYSLGCVLYACLTGRPPFIRDSAVSVMYAHCADPPPGVSEHRRDLPAELDEILGRALAKEPEDRPRSASELIQAVGQAVGAAKPAPQPSPPRRERGGRARGAATPAAPSIGSPPAPPAVRNGSPAKPVQHNVPQAQPAEQGRTAAPRAKPATPPGRVPSNRKAPPAAPARKPGASRRKSSAPPPWETWQDPKPRGRVRPGDPAPGEGHAASRSASPPAAAPKTRDLPSRASRPAAHPSGRPPAEEPLRPAARSTADALGLRASALPAAPPAPAQAGPVPATVLSAPPAKRTVRRARRPLPRTRRPARRAQLPGRSLMALGLVLVAAAGTAGWLIGGSEPDTAGAEQDRAATVRADATAAAVRARNDWRADTETAISQLDSRRTAGRRQLARARTRTGQARSADSLARSFGAAARGVDDAPASIDAAPRLEAALRRSERGYRRLAGAARRGRGYPRARAEVIRAEAGVVRAIKDLD